MMALTAAAASRTDGKPSSSVRDRRRERREPHRDPGGDAERALAADERAPQVVAGRLGVEAAEHRDLAVGQHDLEGEDVGAGHARGEAVRAARVVGDVAADRARLLARRVGGEVEPERRELPVEVEVDHAGLDPGHPRLGVDRQDAVHLRGDDHDRVAERHRAAGQPGARRRGRRTGGRGGGRPARRPAPRRCRAGSRPPRPRPAMSDASRSYSDRSSAPSRTRSGASAAGARRPARRARPTVRAGSGRCRPAT